MNLPRLTLADLVGRQLERIVRDGDEGAWLRLAGFYDAVRTVVLDGGALDEPTLLRLADLYTVDRGLARRLRQTALGDAAAVRQAWPRGAELLARAQAALAAQMTSSRPAAAIQAPQPWDAYGTGRKVRTGD